MKNDKMNPQRKLLRDRIIKNILKRGMPSRNMIGDRGVDSEYELELVLVNHRTVDIFLDCNGPEVLISAIKEINVPVLNSKCDCYGNGYTFITAVKYDVYDDRLQVELLELAGENHMGTVYTRMTEDELDLTDLMRLVVATRNAI